MSRLKELKQFLGNTYPTGRLSVRHDIECLPITHNKGYVILQFSGWSVNLYEDGTWIVEDTTGG